MDSEQSTLKEMFSDAPKDMSYAAEENPSLPEDVREKPETKIDQLIILYSCERALILEFSMCILIKSLA